MKTRDDRVSTRATDARGEWRVAPRRLALIGTLAASLAATAATAQDAGRGMVELWVNDAPLAAVLQQIAGKDGVRVVVGDDVDGRVDGRLDGSRETVLATLAVEHELSVHAEEDTVWFDPTDQPVVSLIPLASTDAKRAVAALASERPQGTAVQGTEEGLVLSGPRAFVEGARRRIAALADLSPDVSDAPDTPPPPRVRSISDIPGFDVDYLDGSTS